MIAKSVGTYVSPSPADVGVSRRSEDPVARVSPTPSGRKRAAVTGSTQRKAPVRKPYPSFPLTPHPSGQFCKKIRGKLFYFGSVADSEAALERYHRL